ncbi:hypothetical protein BKA57DRAFT_492286 [Linnemannia elongata]|nr:hypothetical protein BKA57DRAFT_492286 [Linnemannia elongata]
MVFSVAFSVVQAGPVAAMTHPATQRVFSLLLLSLFLCFSVPHSLLFINRIKNLKSPSLDVYTPEQLFFIANGNLWHDKMRPLALCNLARTNYHSAAKWHINGVAQSSLDFEKAFKCKAGAPINHKKCELVGSLHPRTRG